MDALPLPEHPVLRAVAERVEERRLLAEVWDARWRLAYQTRDFLLSSGTTAEAAAPGLGVAVYAEETYALRTAWPSFATTDSWLATVRRLLPGVAHDLPGGADELREAVMPQLASALEGLTARRADSPSFDGGEIKYGSGPSRIG